MGFRFTEYELDEVERWRCEELEHAGYLPREARLLSRRGDLEFHRAVELLERDCPAELALRILL